MSVGEWLYEKAARVAPVVMRAAAPFSEKVAKGVTGRRTALDQLERWAREQVRFDHGPIVWFHAPSVGEALMAQVILAELRKRRPGMRAAFTFFSPSAERVAERVGADVTSYLPWDRREDMGRVLAVLEPAAVVFVRTEIWPVLVRLAAGQGRPTLLVNAALSSGSSRLRAPARRILHDAYVRLDAVGAVSADDAARFPRLGVQSGRVHVTGDARFDQVARRIAGLDRDAPLLRRLREPGVFNVVGGSTWPPDEERLVSAIAKLREDGNTRLIIAPHEPIPEHLKSLERRLDRAGLAHARLGAVEEGAAPADAVVVDRVGVLADLYAVADAAWIGGGFGRDGLHSVVEPAALGVPVLCGPNHGNAREAGELTRERGAFIVRDADDALGQLRRLRVDADARASASRSARMFVEARLGGAARNAELIDGFLPR